MEGGTYSVCGFAFFAGGCGVASTLEMSAAAAMMVAVSFIVVVVLVLFGVELLRILRFSCYLWLGLREGNFSYKYYLYMIALTVALTFRSSLDSDSHVNTGFDFQIPSILEPKSSGKV